MKVKNRNLRNYLIKYMGIIMTVSSVYLIKEGSTESIEKRDEIWDYLKKKDLLFYRKVSSGILSRSMKTKSKTGHRIVKVGYQVSKKIFKFG